MKITAAFTALLGFILKCMVGGWFTLLFIWIYVPIGFTHVVIHGNASQSIPQTRALAIVSNVLLLMAFLVQLDEGDGPCRWITITGLLYGPGFSPCFDQPWLNPFFNLIAFVPAAITWVFLVIPAFKDPHS
jgi:hypothetical protein